MDESPHAVLAATLRRQARSCADLGAPFYEEMLKQLADDAARGGTVAEVLAAHATAPYEAAYALRLLGAVHRMVLEGRAPALAARYPSTGGDGDATAAAAALLVMLADPPPEVVDALGRPPQTNEVGRALALASGLLVVAHRTGRPVRLRELGSSGGLNLRLDAFWYAQGGAGWGDPSSPVRFVDLWDGALPPLDAPLAIVDRRGCDRDPIDVTTAAGSLTLLSYVWPEPAARFSRARDAIELARARPVTVDRADAGDWLGAELTAVSGTACVVMHSVVWQYLDDATRAAAHASIEAAGDAASPDTPVAWLRLEPTPGAYAPAQLRLDLWDGAGPATRDELLATSGFHGGPLRWFGDDSLRT